MQACALQAAAAGAPARVRHHCREDTCRLGGAQPAASACPRRRLRCLAGSDEAADGGVSVEEEGRSSLTGEELRELVVAKWGRPYDTRLCQRRNRFNKLTMYLQIMWCVLPVSHGILTATPLTDPSRACCVLSSGNSRGRRAFPSPQLATRSSWTRWRSC